MNKAVLKDAAWWFARLHSGETTETDRRAWDTWLAAHPDHRLAWRHVEALQDRLQSLPGSLSAATLRIASSDEIASKKSRRHPIARRDVLKSFSVVLALGSVAGMGLSRGRWKTWRSDHHTLVGERKTIALADGSTLILNTDTAVDVAFDEGMRLVRLNAGEILIETAPDTASVPRPFIVETAQGRVRALGTRFTVRRLDSLTEVVVLRDAVSIQPLEGSSPPWVLRTNQRTLFSSTEVESPRPADESRAAWTRGMLVVSNWSLADLAGELERYRPGWLFCDPEVAGLRISGAFPVDNTDLALAAMEQALPVRIVRRSRYWARIESRG